MSWRLQTRTRRTTVDELPVVQQLNVDVVAKATSGAFRDFSDVPWFGGDPWLPFSSVVFAMLALPLSTLPTWSFVRPCLVAWSSVGFPSMVFGGNPRGVGLGSPPTFR